MIKVDGLNQTFKVHKKQPGLVGTLKSFFKRKYIEKKALVNINITINKGEFIGLIGSNGAGKTTLAKILSGIIYPTSGSVSVLGHVPFQKKNEYRKQMSIVMGQKAQVWWDLPAMDSFILLKEIYQIPNDIYNESIEELSKALNIKEQLLIPVRRLSLGERMKVELIAALLHRPKVIFLDEPTIGLDITAQKAVRVFLKNYQKKYHPIIILTSHYMDDIEELCERIVILRKGSVVFDGDIAQVKAVESKERVIKVSPAITDDTRLSFAKEMTHSNNQSTFRVSSNHLNKTLSELSSQIEVKDLSISKPEISETIEKLMVSNS